MFGHPLLSVFNVHLLQEPLFIVPLRPAVVNVSLMGELEVEPLLPIVGKIYHLTPTELHAGNELINQAVN